ncbi:hypothetical protein [Marinifilum fragile]|uniref:hypothetical protein n=1 Tax=Marinifilum fragile TaxID=570161 RepID=UPI002AA801DC|nr:hypothetical protein [Marinifilum fragile]
MRKNNRRQEFQIPSKLADNKDNWEKIAKGEVSKDEIKGDVYKGKRTVKGETKYEVRESLSEMYHFKCAYCESIERKPEVEHYRPKKEVTEDPDHEGYYWLCYEWTNLLPSCRYCNTEGGKGNKFPITGDRVTNSPIKNGEFEINKCKLDAPELIAEKPILLHPEVDIVENYFSFKNNGEVCGVDQEDRGKETVNICNLNRDNLKVKRQSVIDKHIADLEDILLDIDDSEETIEYGVKQVKRKLDRLIDSCDCNKEFSLLQMNCLYHYEELVISQLQTESQKEFVKEIYREFMDKKFGD